MNAPYDETLRPIDFIKEASEMKAKRIRFGAIAALLALLSLFLFVAACGGDDDDNGHADPTATESVADDATATEPADLEPTDVSAATEPAAAETTIDVSLAEFTIEPSDNSAPAGTVTFNVTSDGAIFHNFRVIATDLAPDALPTDDATFGVDEAQVDIVASSADLDPGDAEEVTVDLEAGSYVLICNIPTHYDIGMTVAFTIE